MYYTSHFVIDWDKVDSLEDIMLILEAMNITFEPNQDVSKLLKFVRLEDKPPPQQTYD